MAVTRVPYCLLKIACAPLLLALIAACAHVPRLGVPSLTAPTPPSRDTAIKQMQATTPCCHDWNELPFHRTLPDEPRDYLVEPSSPVADLNGERTHYLTFVLPGFDQPYRVLFKAQPSARGLQSSYLFAPTATLLDAQFQPLSHDDIKLCEYIGWRPGQSGAFGQLAIDDARAKYLAVTTSPGQLQASTYWEQSPAGFSSDVFSDPASRGNFSISHGPDGSLSVGRLTPKYDGAMSDAICGKPKK